MVRKTHSFLEDTGKSNLKSKFTRSCLGKGLVTLRLRLSNSAHYSCSVQTLPENRYLSQTITHRLYDFRYGKLKLRIFMLRRTWRGAKLIDDEAKLQSRNVYHFEWSAWESVQFFTSWKNLAVKRKSPRRVVFTTHTPEESRNKAYYFLCERMGLF